MIIKRLQQYRLYNYVDFNPIRISHISLLNISVQAIE